MQRRSARTRGWQTRRFRSRSPRRSCATSFSRGRLRPAAAFAAIRAISEPFGPHTDAEWRFLVDNVLVRRDDGTYALHYDPAIGVPFRASLAAPGDVDLWSVWDAVRVPALVIRGERSDLLAAEVADAMTKRGPRAALVTLPGVGHAPTLVPQAQIAIVREFLERP